VTPAAISLAFFDFAHEIHGTAREGMTLVWEARAPTVLDEPAEISREGDGYRASAASALDLIFTPASEPLALPGGAARVCRVAGEALGRPVECLGTATEAQAPPAWEDLDALRSISALFEPDRALLAVARRPRGARGQDEELVTAHLLAGDETAGAEEVRLSTVYDGDGRQRSAGLELWLPGLDFPRRASGTVLAGASIALEGLRVNAAVFSWHMEGRHGVGAYDLTVRDEPDAA